MRRADVRDVRNHLIWIRWGLLSYKDTGWIFPPGVNTIGQARNWRALSSLTLTQISTVVHRIHSLGPNVLSLYLSFSLTLFLPSFTLFFSPRDEGRVPWVERERAKACWKFSWWACLKLLSIAWSIFDLPQYYHSSLPLFFLFPPLEPELHSLLKAAMHSSFSNGPANYREKERTSDGVRNESASRLRGFWGIEQSVIDTALMQ